MYIYFDYYRLFGSVLPHQTGSFPMPSCVKFVWMLKQWHFAFDSPQWLLDTGESAEATVAWAAASRPVKHLKVAL